MTAGKDISLGAFRADCSTLSLHPESVERYRRLIDGINCAHTLALSADKPHKPFEVLLDVFKELAGSEHGFIAELQRDSSGAPQALAALAISNIAWNEATRAAYAQYESGELKFLDFNTLFGHVVTSGQAVISNDPETDPRAKGVADGHPRLRNFLGLPLYSRHELLGVACVANCPHDYSHDLVEFLQPLCNACGSVLDSLLQVRQRVAAEQALFESEQQFRAIVEATPGCVKILRRDGSLVMMNRRGLEMAGVANLEQIRGKCLYPTVLPEYREAFQRYNEAVCDGYSGSMIYGFVSFDGQRHHTEGFGAPFFAANGETMHLAVAHDISGRLEADRQVLAALQKAEAASQAKSEFLANISHEIRTPMTAILGYAELLADQADTNDSHEAAQTICRNGKHLLGIIDDILDLSRIEAGQFQIAERPCCAISLVKEVHDLMKVRADAKGLQLRVRIDGRVPNPLVTDPVRLRQILVNVVGNALKFTEVGHVEISVSAEQRNDQNLLQIGVRDTGIGIPVEELERIFEPFSQVDNSVRRVQGGTGLGLVVSRRLAELLGGQIAVTSEPGKGSHFQITIAFRTPLSGIVCGAPNCSVLEGLEMKLPVALALPGGDSALENLRILLVEDGPDNQRLIAHLLRKSGANVELAVNGLEAVCRIYSQAPADVMGITQQEWDPATRRDCSGEPEIDLILMDMQMPVMDGYTATRELRRRGYDGPILALTAHAMTYDREKCLQAGCDDYLTKPLERAALIAALRMHVRERENQKAKSANG